MIVPSLATAFLLRDPRRFRSQVHPRQENEGRERKVPLSTKPSLLRRDAALFLPTQKPRFLRLSPLSHFCSISRGYSLPWSLVPRSQLSLFLRPFHDVFSPLCDSAHAPRWRTCIEGSRKALGRQKKRARRREPNQPTQKKDGLIDLNKCSESWSNSCRP